MSSLIFRESPAPAPDFPVILPGSERHKPLEKPLGSQKSRLFPGWIIQRDPLMDLGASGAAPHWDLGWNSGNSGILGVFWGGFLG